MASSIPRPIAIGLAAAAGLALIAAGALLILHLAGRTTPGDLPVLARMPDFALTDQSGQPVSAADLKGKVLLVGFIYTSCPDICPMVTANMKALQDDLARTGLLGEAHLLSISVDPETDTPARLADYARLYQAETTTWTFLTGDADHVRKVVVEGFLLGLNKVPAAGHDGHASAADYRVEHSGRLVLVDREGRIRAYFDGTAPDLGQVLAQVRALAEGR